MSHTLNRIAIVFFALLVVASSAWAGPQARISGTVKDSEGKPIADAVITITSDEAPSYEKVIEPNEKGYFKALILDATRNYIFHVTAPGYLKHQEAFKVSVGTTDNEFPFVLKTAAEESVQKQLELLEQPGYKQLDEGRKFFEAGNIAEAEKKYKEAVALVPDLLPAWLALIEISAKTDDHARTLELAEKCLEIDDEAVTCLAVAANAALDLGDKEKSDQYMTLYQELNPNDPTTLFNTAVEHLNKMDDASAKPILEECLEANPDFGSCLFHYGMVLLRSGDMEGAKKHLQRYLEVEPEGEDAAAAADIVKYL